MTGNSAGVRTCAQFAKDYTANPELIETLYFTWAQGYLTGFARASKTEPDLMPAKRGETWQKSYVREYCAKNPLSPFSEAAASLNLELAKFHASQRPQPAAQGTPQDAMSCEEYLANDEVNRGRIAGTFLWLFLKENGDALGPHLAGMVVSLAPEYRKMTDAACDVVGVEESVVKASAMALEPIIKAVAAMPK